MKGCDTIMKFFKTSSQNVTAAETPCLGNTIENSNLPDSETLFIDNSTGDLILSPLDKLFVGEKNP